MTDIIVKDALRRIANALEDINDRQRAEYEGITPREAVAVLYVMCQSHQECPECEFCRRDVIGTEWELCRLADLPYRWDVTKGGST